MELIPTAYKGRLRKGMSHPVGAELMSEALAGVPPWHDLSLHFNAIPRHGIGLFTPGGGLHYLRGKVGKQLLGFNEYLYCGFWDPGVWTIGTFPVFSGERKSVRLALEHVALPRLRAWLGKKRTETWMQPQRVVQIGLNTEFSEVGFLETNNDRVVTVEKLPVTLAHEPSEGS